MISPQLGAHSISICWSGPPLLVIVKGILPAGGIFPGATPLLTQYICTYCDLPAANDPLRVEKSILAVAIAPEYEICQVRVLPPAFFTVNPFWK